MNLFYVNPIPPQKGVRDSRLSRIYATLNTVFTIVITYYSRLALLATAFPLLSPYNIEPILRYSGVIPDHTPAIWLLLNFYFTYSLSYLKQFLQSENNDRKICLVKTLHCIT